MKLIQRAFLKGLLAVLPVTATLYLLFWFATKAEGAFGGLLMEAFPGLHYIPGMGVTLAFLVISVIGMTLNAWIAQRFFSWAESWFETLPVIKSVYKPMKDLMGLLSGGKGKGLNRVVMVDFFDGKKLVGLMTRDSFEDIKLGTELKGRVAVFFPMSYALGGVTMLVNRDQVTELNIPVDRALNLAITGWIKKSD
jgi:uncharacterized membrane protein